MGRRNPTRITRQRDRRSRDDALGPEFAGLLSILPSSLAPLWRRLHARATADALCRELPPAIETCHFVAASGNLFGKPDPIESITVQKNPDLAEATCPNRRK
jgi:hypothetical protein